jgi:phthalate 4,5-dioxygenase
MTELMCNERGEAIYDRTQEHLTSSDAMIIAVRKQLLAAVKKLRDTGEAPANVDGVFAIRPYSRTSRRRPPSATATTIPSL